MLIEFSATNFRSIRERQTLNMAAVKAYKEHEENNTFDPGTEERKLPRLLRSAVIYGPNAGGKSNLIQALWFIKWMVRHSARDRAPDEKLPLAPFRLAVSSRRQDSEFEIIFIADQVRYQFGFRVNQERVTEEWLHAFPQGSPQKWFHRRFDAAQGMDHYVFSNRFQGGRERESWKKATRANALFLSTAILLNSRQLMPVHEWFSSLMVIGAMADFRGVTALMIDMAEKKKKKVIQFLQSADLCVEDILVEQKGAAAPPDFRDKSPQQVMDAVIGHRQKKIKIAHRSADDDGSPIFFDLADESAGTRNLFDFAAIWIDSIENGCVLVVDELDTSLHPLIVQQLIRMIHQPGPAQSQAQLIFTTHDTSLLSRKILRRDQVWFIEKDARQASHLYPLSDFSVREQDAVEKAYLAGRYDALPFLRDLDFHD